MIINMLTWLRDQNEPITTHHIFPPIPIRDFDWCAYRDPEVTPYGYGHTEEAAIADLLELEDDQMKAKFKNPDQQYIYQLYMTGAAGPNVRSSLQTAFKRGLSGFNFDVEHERASLTYAAWSAGYDIRKSRLPGGSMGVWCVDTDQHGVIQGWIEMFKTDDGRLVTIPDSGRYITVRDPQ